MDKNLVRFGFIGIVLLVVFAAVQLYPPSQTLKPGLDLAGGTSLIYEIDTTGLEAKEINGLAQRLIPILRKRIDPGNIQNIVMRPHGDTRIEIQVPLASPDTHEKRQAYDDALQDLAKDNINLAIIKRSLDKDAVAREAAFAKFAGQSQSRKDILTNLASAYDTRKAAQLKRDASKTEMDKIAAEIESAGVSVAAIARISPDADPETQTKAIDRALSDVKNADDARKLVQAYITAHKNWAQTVNELTTPETGINSVYHVAEAQLRNFNISVDAINQILEMPAKSFNRAKMLQQYKDSFPARIEKLEKLVAAFEIYRPVRGRIDGPQDVKRMLKGAGVLEFRILPAVNDGKATSDELMAYVEELKTNGPKLASDNKYVWIKIEDFENSKIRPSENRQIVLGMFADNYYVLTSNQKNECLLKTTGNRPWKLQKARPTADQLGKRAIDFVFDEIGGKYFYSITKNNLERPLCIILDGVAISAPNISSAIRQRGIIEGDFSAQEQLDMINKLNAGSLPARLIDPVLSEKTIGASMGASNRDQGVTAGFIGLAAIAVFMLIYYTKAGSIADTALFMNILFILGVMALSRATFTLPGIAGIILTIGMSVDANVLIFERIREEQLKGSSLAIAIESGYARAFRTILDANVTTFITALILYMVASEEIKGFAITLMIGIISSMFTALFATRVFFQILQSKGLIKDHLLMMRIIKNPTINWMGLRHIFFGISAVLVVGGMFIFFGRDEEANSKYDIEFTGGTSVQINLKADSPLSRDEVENLIREKGRQLANPAISSAKVYSIGDKEAMTQYEITTTETNKTTSNVVFKSADKTIEQVKAMIEDAQKSKRGKLSNLIVQADANNPAAFVIATSQVNRSVIKNILAEAFGDTAEISAPVVDKIVNRSIMEAFAGKLEIMENLKPTVIFTNKIDDTLLEKMPELSEFIGGIAIEFTVAKPTSIAKMQARLKALRFKPDMQHIAWYNNKLFNKDLTNDNQDELISSFIYAGTEAEAGYREFSNEEWAEFIKNETEKITTAATMETSLPRVTQIAPSIGKQAKNRAIVAIILSLLAIVAYIWVRFGTVRYGLAAIIALVHDVCITLGLVTACTYVAGTAFGQAMLIGDFKIDLAMIAAFLTIIGYSLNDTIVVFDRIRENRGRLADINPQIITNSINQTLSRTILTSVTTFIVVLIMYIFGGTGLRGFTFAMLAGILIGTYSSIAIAAPILIFGKKTTAKK